MLGYRSTPAGLRMLRRRTVCPAGVIVDSSLRSRLLRRDVESRLVTPAASAVAAASPRRCGLVVQPNHQGPRSAHCPSRQPPKSFIYLFAA